MKTRSATIEDCQRCSKPPKCPTAPHPCDIDVIEIQVGDEVIHRDGSIGHVVAFPNSIHDTCRVAVKWHSGLGTVSTPMLKNLTFISRPEKPKEHVFKGVKSDKFNSGVMMIIGATDLEDNKTYTAVFTEED